MHCAFKNLATFFTRTYTRYKPIELAVPERNENEI